MSKLNDYDFFTTSTYVYNNKYLNDGTPIEINKKKWIVVKYVDKKGYSDLQAIAIVSEKESASDITRVPYFRRRNHHQKSYRK